MLHRWVWSVFDLIALICLGQASLLAQRGMVAPPKGVFEIPRAERQADGFDTRIYETPEAVVVAVHPRARAAREIEVSVRDRRIFLAAASGAAAQIPVPAAADALRYCVRRVGDELRVVFEKK